MRAMLLVPIALALVGCDESQVWHTPQWSAERMQEQARIDPFDPQMRAPLPFTVARGEGPSRLRPRVTRELVETGRRAFERTCAACHGIRGDGDSVVAAKMILRKPPALFEPRLRGLSDLQIHEVVERGYGLMPSYQGLLTFEERWAVVSYVRALQRSQAVDVASLTPDLRAELAKEAP